MLFHLKEIVAVPEILEFSYKPFLNIIESVNFIEVKGLFESDNELEKVNVLLLSSKAIPAELVMDAELYLYVV